jgi:hypothetical protein
VRTSDLTFNPVYALSPSSVLRYLQADQVPHRHPEPLPNWTPDSDPFDTADQTPLNLADESAYCPAHRAPEQTTNRDSQHFSYQLAYDHVRPLSPGAIQCQTGVVTILPRAARPSTPRAFRPSRRHERLLVPAPGAVMVEHALFPLSVA